MRRVMLAVVLSTSLAACQSASPPRANIAHGDGSSPEHAVDLSAAHSEGQGIRAERDWLNRHYPGAQVKSQSLLSGPPVMDLIRISLPSGEERDVYFDISSYFGKW